MQEVKTHSTNVRTTTSPTILTSWKEISSYLGRGVRTVQRWESELQFPIHRIGKSKRSPVYAVISEVRFWMMRPTGQYAKTLTGLKTRPPYPIAQSRESLLVARLHQLAQAVAEATVHHENQAELLGENTRVLRSRLSDSGPDAPQPSLASGMQEHKQSSSAQAHAGKARGSYHQYAADLLRMRQSARESADREPEPFLLAVKVRWNDYLAHFGV